MNGCSDHRVRGRIFQPSGAQASVRCYQWVRTGPLLYIEATFSFTVISPKRSGEDRSIRSTDDGKYPTLHDERIFENEMRRMHLIVPTRPHALLTDIPTISQKWERNLRNVFSYDDVSKSFVFYSIKVLALEQIRTIVFDVDFALVEC